MAKTQNIGLVSVTPKGAWSNTANYKRLDIVSHGGGSYMAMQASVGVEPSVTTGWASYWQVLAEKATGGSGGGGGTSGTAVLYVSQSLTTAQQAQARANIGVGVGKVLEFANRTLYTTNFSSDITYSSFPYKYSLALEGVTTTSYVEVIFDADDAMSGNFAPICKSYNGGVYIWAKEVPSDIVIIPTILSWEI